MIRDMEYLCLFRWRNYSKRLIAIFIINFYLYFPFESTRAQISHPLEHDFNPSLSPAIYFKPTTSNRKKGKPLENSFSKAPLHDTLFNPRSRIEPALFLTTIETKTLNSRWPRPREIHKF